MNADRVLELTEAEREVAKMELTMPTDIHYIKEVVGILPHAPLSRRCPLLVWIQVLLKNPFDVSRFITTMELDVLKLFLLDSLTCPDHRLRKVAIRAIALLVNSVSHGGEGLYSMSEREFLLLGREVSEMDFYSFLKQLSKIGSVPRKYVEFSDSDHVVITRYKIKTLSYFSASPVSDMKKMMNFINVDDARLGWTLSKSMYRLSKHLDKYNLVKDLKDLISGAIFGDEQLWVNVMSLLGFFAFDGNSVGDVCTATEALLYDKEFVQRSTSVRESALFLHWCMLRSSLPIGDAIYTIVFVSLFDRELICRRAAASIVQEYIGRAQGTVDLLGKGQGLDDGILQIDPGSVKRPENCLRIFCAIGQKHPYRQLIFDMLYSFNRLRRIQAAEIIARFYDPLGAPLRYETVSEIDGLHFLIANALKIASNSSPSLRDSLKRHFKDTVSRFVLTPQMYRVRNMQGAIESYLMLHDIADSEPFKRNILFLISKGFNPELILGAMGPYMQDPDFSKAVFSAINKNPSGILANSRNVLLRSQCICRFLANLESRTNARYTIRALTEMDAYTDDVRCTVKGFLNDYTVDMCGDSGYFNRKEALFYFLKLRNKVHVPDVAIEHFIIRFMADKSKRLREDTLKALLSGSYARFKQDFGYIYNTASHCQPALALDGNCAARIEKFFLIHAELSKECGNEQAYFRALFASFPDSEHFHYGIINTLSASDRRLFEIITELASPMKDKLAATALGLIKRRTLVGPSLRLFLTLKDSIPSLTARYTD